MFNSHLIDLADMSDIFWDSLYSTACGIKDGELDCSQACKGRILSTLFYEPSTRTQFSFQSAMLRLGGNVLGFSNPNDCSVAKGETLRDTIKIMSAYSDLLVIRSPVEGSAYAASLYSEIPIINAGDGGHLHPTQTLTDLMTIAKLKGSYTGLNIGVCGDLLNGRTVHSLLKAFCRYSGNTFYLISTPTLAAPDYALTALKASSNRVVECDSIDSCIPSLDILYMTRIQRERFASAEDYQKQRGVFVLDGNKLRSAKKDLCILHPLPKVDEISPEVDDDSRAKYFEQARYGMYIRMALLMLLSKNGRLTPSRVEGLSGARCSSPRCVTNQEKYLPVIARQDNTKLCAYCEAGLENSD
ncbi:MAG: aspartate carbamoyltransferase [Eubacteriales bacterium]